MTIFFAIILFSLLVFIHEFGHFAAAKLSGVQVNEFSIFMGPAIWSKQMGDTLYSLRLIPFGGYCAMEGEDGESDNPRAFGQAAWWKRLIILVAGAAMNFLAGVILMVAIFLPVKQTVVPVLSELEPFCTMAGENGVQVGDRILSVDGERIYVFSDFSMLLNLNGGNIHDLVVERDGKKIELPDLLMEKTPVTQPDGSVIPLYGLNFTLAQLDIWDRIQLAWSQCLDTVRLVRLSLQMLLRGQAGLKDMSGPVGIVQQMSQVADSSPTALDALINMLYFGAFIAINLAVMNLLPIPALDGGRAVGLLLTTAVEAVTHRKIDPKYEGYLHTGGMLALLALMALIMFKDIWTLFQ